MSENAQHTKRALVTGASRGIGLAITEALLQKGIQVVGLGKSQENLDKLKEKFPQVDTVCVDLGEWQATKEAVDKLGHFDYLVNNAGWARRIDFFDMEPDYIDSILAVNLKAAINVSQVVGKKMRDKGTGGAIVNVSSVAGQKAYKKMSAYCASKAALDQLTRVMAYELGTYNIRVNGVSPGITDTDMAKKLLTQTHLIEKLKATIPLGRYSEPTDVANIVLFLLSDESYMINGSVIPIDGGLLSY